MDLFDDLPAPNQTDTVPSHSVIKDGIKQLTAPPGKRKVEDDKITQDESPTKKSSTGGITLLRGLHAAMKGERADMQDAHIIIDDLLPQISSPHPDIRRLAFYGVYDGHAGVRAARYSAEHLHQILIRRFPKGSLDKVESEIKKCFVEAYKETDQMFLKEASKKKPSWKDGTTATTVLVLDNTLYIANLGDSKAVLCRQSKDSEHLTAVPLTKDHNPSLYDERIRIQKAGGQVREGRVMGILEVSRSIGDGPYKKHGVICIPDVRRCQLTDNDRFLLIACDGLWKAFAPQAAAEFIDRKLQMLSESQSSSFSLDDHCEEVCAALTAAAVRKLSGDNVTVVLIKMSSS